MMRSADRRVGTRTFLDKKLIYLIIYRELDRLNMTSNIEGIEKGQAGETRHLLSEKRASDATDSHSIEIDGSRLE